MQLSESEIQLLASLAKARSDDSGTSRAALEAGAARFWVFKEDWSDAYSSLSAKGLISGGDEHYTLTGTGLSLAESYHEQRPDMYWYYYQKFYQAAGPSQAHSKLCQQVFGEDLCQEGQTDMTALRNLLHALSVKPEEQVLDLGCGAGGIAAFIAQTTGAIVTGLDYSEPAIAEAKRRTSGAQEAITFAQGDMNALELTANSLDVVVSFDTLYWASDLDRTLSALVDALRPGGRMGLFMNHHIGEEDDPAMLSPEHAELSKSLNRLGLAFETSDYTAQIGVFWRRIQHSASELQSEFEAEGNGFIAASLIREADEDYLPDIMAGRIARHLYLVRC